MVRGDRFSSTMRCRIFSSKGAAFSKAASFCFSCYLLLVKFRKVNIFCYFYFSRRKEGLVQHAVKNIARKVLNLNDITLNKRCSGLIGLSSEMRNDFLPPTVTNNARKVNSENFISFWQVNNWRKKISSQFDNLF